MYALRTTSSGRQQARGLRREQSTEERNRKGRKMESDKTRMGEEMKQQKKEEWKK
jgi:hypothetical protein